MTLLLYRESPDRTGLDLQLLLPADVRQGERLFGGDERVVGVALIAGSQVARSPFWATSSRT